jgi:hypothetical protein
MFFFDPHRGHARRTVARDRLEAAGRHTLHHGRGLARGIAAWARGRLRRFRHRYLEHLTPVDDQTLAQRVKSMLFRDPRAPRGKITIDAEHGTIVLRGALDRLDDIRRVERETYRVPGVRAVLNLLHQPGTPAPNKREALDASHHRVDR